MPAFPRELSYLWRIYHRIRRRIGSGFSSANPIGWRDVEAFMRVTRFHLAPWEVELLETIDDAYLQPQYVALRDKAKKPDATEMIDVGDTKSVRSLMRKLGKRRGKGGASSQT